MTREQHLAMAAFHGAHAESWAHPSQGYPDKAHDYAVLHAIAAAHHGLLAQRCDECDGMGDAENSEGWWDDNCPVCKGDGWVPCANPPSKS